MRQSLRLIDRQPKPQRHLGVMRSDDVLRPYLEKLEGMPQKYRVEVDRPAPILRRARRWVCRLFS